MTNQSVTRHRSRLYTVSALPVALLLAAILLSLAACDLTAANPTPTPDPVAQAISEIPNATAVNIRDDWAGLSLTAPHLAHYILTRTGGGLTGTAEFAAGESRGTPITATETIDIPASGVQDFLAKLAAAPLKAGSYSPRIDHTDDYPNISITLDIPSGPITFYTQSQGTDHTPWGASIANKDFVIETPDAMNAFLLLDPYLKKDVLEKVIEEANNRQ